MYCNGCGTELHGAYCHACGRANPARHAPARRGPLERPRQGRKIAGVCLAVANSLDWDPTLVRVLWAVITILCAFIFGILAYAVAWVLIPEEPLPVAAANGAGINAAGS